MTEMHKGDVVAQRNGSSGEWEEQARVPGKVMLEMGVVVQQKSDSV